MSIMVNEITFKFYSNRGKRLRKIVKFKSPGKDLYFSISERPYDISIYVGGILNNKIMIYYENKNVKIFNKIYNHSRNADILIKGSTSMKIYLNNLFIYYNDDLDKIVKNNYILVWKDTQ